MAENKNPRVIFCNDSPKRVLVSVIKTTPIKPRKSEALTPTSPGFSDFMVYPWKWGENAHNVSLSPGSASEASSPTGTQTAGEVDPDSSQDQNKVGAIKVYADCHDPFRKLPLINTSAITVKLKLTLKMLFGGFFFILVFSKKCKHGRAEVI